jgi:hypothetical protein
MSRLNTDPRLPQSDDIKLLKTRLYEINRDIAQQVNDASEGRLSAATNKATAAPTTGVYAVGDVVRNSAPAELGGAGSKYVIYGFMCITAPLTFVQMRFLTGN